jgi:hypothetical protein
LFVTVGKAQAACDELWKLMEAMMMNEGLPNPSARDNSIDVLVQLADQQWRSTMHMSTIWQELEKFERGGSRKRKNWLEGFTREGLVFASFKLLDAVVANDAHRVCVAAVWMMFRRPEEMHSDFEATRMLNEIVDEQAGARIVIVGDYGASLESFVFQVTEPWVPDDYPHLDLTPRMDGSYA